MPLPLITSDSRRLLLGRRKLVLSGPQTWYLTNNSVGPGSDLSQTDPGAEANRTPLTGWITSAAAANSMSEYFNDIERAAVTFTAGPFPDGSLDTANGDWWVIPQQTGSYAAGNWVVHFAARAVTAGSNQDTRIRCRLHRGPNLNGSGATEITAGVQIGTGIVDLLTTVTQVSTVTFNPGGFSLTNEFTFIQLACEKTSGDLLANGDILARIGNASGTGCRVITPAFS